MEFSQMKKKIIENGESYIKKHQIEDSDHYPLLKLAEELGELSEAFINYKGNSRPEKTNNRSEQELKDAMAHEMADIIGTTVYFSHKLGIDIEDAIDKKWLNNKEIK